MKQIQALDAGLRNQQALPNGDGKYAVFNGQQVPVTTAAWPLQFGIPAPNARRSVPAVDVQPVGHTTWFDISERAEVSLHQ